MHQNLLRIKIHPHFRLHLNLPTYVHVIFGPRREKTCLQRRRRPAFRIGADRSVPLLFPYQKVSYPDLL